MHHISILEPNTDRAAIDDLLADGYTLVDAWPSALEDLDKLNSLVPNTIAFDRNDLEGHSRYIVYPWRMTVVRLPEDRIFHALRTARNCYLITDEEQATWASSTVAIAGLSVGGSVLGVCALTGARNLRIADPDTLGPSNLNRLVGSVCDLGVSKTTLGYRRVVEADPYARVETFPDGFSAASAADFIGSSDDLGSPDSSGGQGKPKAAVILEEMDDIARKVEIRRLARDAQVPVIMITDDGDDVIVDVERYDLDPEYPLFHGRAGDLIDLSEEQLQDKDSRVELAGRIVGHDVDERLQVALGQVGKTLPSWPQLGTAASLAGVVGAVIARKLVCGFDVPSGRARIRVSDAKLFPGV